MTTITTLEGGTVRLDRELEALADDLAGRLIREGDPDYEQARALWNGLTPRRPAAIARCTSTADVCRAVRFAADHDLLVAVRGGGHNVAGTAGVDGGLVIDLSDLRDIEVQPERSRTRAGGGTTFAELDAATQQHGLAVPGGVVSATGIGGLTLSGGIGWLRRKYGLTCDNLVGATLVTADGEVHHVDEHHDPELLWGLRGGGGNFGVVTEFIYRLHAVGPEVFAALVVVPGDRAVEALRGYRDWTSNLPDEVSSMAVCGSIPAEQAIAEEHWEAPGVILAACAATDLTRGEHLVEPLRDLGDPIADLSGALPYVDMQQVFDADYPDGMRYYWRSLHLPGLTDEVIGRAVDWMDSRPSKESTIDFWHLGGQLSRVAPDATAYGDRSAPFLLGIESNWRDPAEDGANLQWTRECAEAFAPLSTGREYLNFPGFLESGERTLRAAHGEQNHARLRRLKHRLDPDNRFRLHQNITADPRPTGS